MPVGVDVLAEEGDLAVAGGGQGPCFVHDVVERPAALRTAAERHDAVRARLVAAVDDRQPRGDGRAPRHGPLPHRPRSRAGEMVRDADDRSTDARRRADRADRCLGRREPQTIDELRLLVGSQEQVDGGVSTSQPGPVRFADRAAGQHDPHARFRGLESRELAHPTDDLLLGALADRASVDDDEVGALERGRLLAAGGQQSPGHLLRIAPVHLAAQRPEVEPRQDPRLGDVFGQARVAGCGGSARGARRRRGDELEHRQRAGRDGMVGHGCAGEPTTTASATPAARRPAATSGGTHNPACASA